MRNPADPQEAVAWLRQPAAIRERAEALFARAAAGGSRHFDLADHLLPAAARYVAEVIKANYPDLAIPYHARWRHFVVGGADRWQALAATLGPLEPAERARIRFDLAIVSVLLDAGAGKDWRYCEGESGAVLTRSEGLAIASFHAFRGGLFSADPARPLRADAERLANLQDRELAIAFQASDANPLAGLEGRAELMRALGRALQSRPDLFGETSPRPGTLFDALSRRARQGRLPAAEILSHLLIGFSAIWPGRVAIDEQALGDVWRHEAAGGEGLTAGLVPFHKLSQWMSYSLVEPLEEAGITVSDLDALTGLPEYRNGGLFIDLGVLRLRTPPQAAIRVDDELVVEWRALTVALLDRIAPLVRSELGFAADDRQRMPLARILEGGTWAAGRKIAGELRADGSPPIQIVSDGTVF